MRISAAPDFVFGGASGSPNVAEASWADAPASAVQVLAQHIADAPHLHHQETQALVAVDSLERRVSLAQRALAHWRNLAGNGSPPPSDSPASVRAQAGSTEPEAATAKAAAALRTDHEPFAAQSPASGSGSLRNRLAVLADRVAGW